MKPLLKRLLFLALAAHAVVAFADTTTSRFGLTKPDVGSTNWGPKLNTNSDTIDNAAGIALNNTFTQTNTFTGPVIISTLTVQGTQSNTGLMSVSSVTASQTVTAGNLSVSGTSTLTGTVTAGTVNATTLLKGKGVTDGSNASSGFIGEYISTSASATSYPSTGNWGDAGSITLTAGDWDITAVLDVIANGATVTANRIGIGTTSGNSSSGLTFGDNAFHGDIPNSSKNGLAAVVVYRVSISGSVTYYLKVEADFTAATPQYRGRLSARRMR